MNDGQMQAVWWRHCRQPAQPSSCVVVCLLLTLMTPVAWSLDPGKELTQFLSESWTSEQGLPQNSATAMLQASDGYLWVGTFEGLTRFDGVRFTVLDTTNTPQLLSNSVARIFEDRQQRLWVAFRADGGLVRLDGGRIEQVFSSADGLLSDTVWDVTEDDRGRLWVATEEGLNRIDGVRVTDMSNQAAVLSQRITALLAEPADTVWIGTQKGGLVRLREGGIRVLTTADGLGSDHVTALCQGTGEQIWVGSSQGTVDRCTGEECEPVLRAAQLQEEYVRALYLDRNGALWVGTYGELGGISRLVDGRLVTFSGELGLNSSFIRSIAEDREGSLWFGSNAGLHRFRESKFSRVGSMEGLGSDFARVLLEDRDGSLWLGTDGGGLARLDCRAGGDGTIDSIDSIDSFSEDDGLLGTSVRALATDHHGGLWIGVYGRGLNYLEHGVFRALTRQDGLPGDLIRALFVDHRGTLWIGDEESGLTSYADGRFTTYTATDGFGSDEVRVILEDRSARLWIGSNDGLYLRQQDSFEVLTTTDGLASNTVFALYEDDVGDLWIGTQNGLSRLRGRDLRSFTARQGLMEHAIFQILEDSQAHLWLSSNRGIFRVAKNGLEAVAEGIVDEVTVTRFGTADGMRIAQCNGTCQPSGWESRDGRLWFPTPAGFLSIRPESINRNQLPPPVLIEEAVVDGRSLPLLPNGVNTIPPGARRIDIRYTGLSLLAPQSVRFQHRLEGVDPDWVDAGGRRTAYYTNLGPGKYLFRVKAANNDGVWSRAPATATLVLQPYFYQTRWFLGSVCVLLVSIVLGSYQLRARHLTRRAQELEQLVDDRTSELLSKNQELEETSHQLAMANRKLQRLSTMDGLTGVANRRRFNELIEAEWRRAVRAGSELALLMIDIDSFKGYNDLYGHLQGDDCLKAVAAALDEGLSRAGDFLARYGGEEFVAILAATQLEGALTVAERMRRKVEDLDLTHEASEAAPVVTVSIGVAVLDLNHESSLRALIEAADRALYQAKQQGRNQVCV